MYKFLLWLHITTDISASMYIVFTPCSSPMMLYHQKMLHNLKAVLSSHKHSQGMHIQMKTLLQGSQSQWKGGTPVILHIESTYPVHISINVTSHLRDVYKTTPYTFLPQKGKPYFCVINWECVQFYHHSILLITRIWLLLVKPFLQKLFPSRDGPVKSKKKNKKRMKTQEDLSCYRKSR